MLRWKSTGGYRMLRAVYASGGLAAVTNVSAGQLPVTTDGGDLHFAELASQPSEPSGTQRPDGIFLNSTRSTMTRVGARYDGSRLTYWWAYTKATPSANLT